MEGDKNITLLSLFFFFYIYVLSQSRRKTRRRNVRFHNSSQDVIDYRSGYVKETGHLRHIQLNYITTGLIYKEKNCT